MSARKTERLLNLVICLLATRRYLSAEQIRRTVAGYEELGDEAFKRKFERDKEDLRDLGIPLQTGSDSSFDDEPGYRIPRDDYSLPPVSFEPAELAALGIAARTWQQASLGGAASGALLKLRAAGVDVDEAVPVAIETRVATSEPAFEPLRIRAAERRPVAFEYREAGATPPRRSVGLGVVAWALVPGRPRPRQGRCPGVPGQPHRRRGAIGRRRQAAWWCPTISTFGQCSVVLSTNRHGSPPSCACGTAPAYPCDGGRSRWCRPDPAGTTSR